MAIEFGKKMREIREDRKWTLEEMAEKLGTTKQALSKYERGERTPKITVAARFAEILGIPLRELVGAESDEKYTEFGNEIRKRTDELKTIEARLLAQGVDSMPKEQREQALAIMKTIFVQYADYFNKENDDET
jgi:transcriptional regulator with XRE-family HTH domain